MLTPGTYQNSNKFPAGTYRNLDRSRENSIFARVDGECLYLERDLKKFRDQEIARNFYFNPSYFPIPFLGDYKRGSCFTDWFVPTSAYCLAVTHEHIHVTVLEQDTSLDEYLRIVDDMITANIRGVYQRFPEAYLHYSGGIDCLVLLSYIIKLGYLERTHLVYHRNLTQAYNPTVSYQDPELYSAIKDALAKFSKRCAGTDIMDFDIGDVAALANARDYPSLTTYTTTQCLEKYQGTAHFHGTLGNSTLFHFKTVCDELIRLNNSYHEFEKEKNTPGYYSSYLYEHTPPRPVENIVPFCDRHLGNKMFNHLDPSRQGNRLFTPLATDEMIYHLRKTNLQSLTFRDVFESRIAVDLIQKNVGTQLDDYIIRGGQNENDNLVGILIPVDLLNNDVLTVAKNVRHHAEGRDWLEYEIDQANSTGHVPINTLVSFVVQHTLESLVN